MLRIGTSGFAYAEWKGSFYPSRLAATRMLEHYAARFATVEINHTFRRYPSEATVGRWREQVPPGFLFSVKAHRRITHMLGLRDARQAVSRFVAAVAPLRERLGPVLFQCPPTLECDPPLLERFLDTLPAGGRFAMEFRHPSWREARPLLAARGIAWCAADTDDAPLAEVPAEPFAYVRLRRTSYSDADLRRWAAKLSRLVAAGTDVFCYLKHEQEGKGPAWAQRLRSLCDRAAAAR